MAGPTLEERIAVLEAWKEEIEAGGRLLTDKRAPTRDWGRGIDGNVARQIDAPVRNVARLNTRPAF